MSTLKVNKLRDTAGSADAITLDPNGGAVLAGVTTVTSVKVGAAVTISESGIEATGVGITCANINGNQIGGRRNLIINGAMLVAQRGNSSTTSGYGSVDRMQIQYGGTDEAPTHTHVDVASGTTPYTLGFRKALKLTNGDQSSGFGADDFIRVDTKLEAQDLVNSGWNSKSSSSYITLSYWVKSSVAQEFFGYLYIDDTPYKYGWSLGSLSADTWTKIVVNIPGNSNLGIDSDNGVGCWINLLGVWGTNKTASDATPNTWGVWDSTKRSTDQAVTWYETNDSTFEITGVQFEAGSQATAFEHRSFAEELKLCQRYYYKSMQYGFTPQQAIPSTGQQDTDVDGYLGWVMYTSTSCRTPYFHHPVDMRTEPTVTIYSSGRVSSPTDNRLAIYNGSAWLNTATCSANVNAKKVGFNGTVSSALTVAGVYLMGGGFDCDAEL